MTNQEIFDKVATHLLTQNARSTANYRAGAPCRYRGDGGKSCAIGCLIPDELYDAAIENVTARVFCRGPYPKSKGELKARKIGEALGFEEKHVLLLTDLQKVHDLAEPTAWKNKLRDVADKHGFSSEVLSQ